MKRPAFYFFVFACLLLLNGCITSSFLYESKITEKGKVKIRSSVFATPAVYFLPSSSYTLFPFMVYAESAISLGVTDWMEIQAKMGNFLSFGLGTSFQLVDSKVFKLVGILQVEGSLFGYFAMMGMNYVRFPIHLLSGFYFSKRISLQLGVGYRPILANTMRDQGSCSGYICLNPFRVYPPNRTAFAHAFAPVVGVQFNTKNFGIRPQVMLEILRTNDEDRGDKTEFIWNVGIVIIRNVHSF